MFADFSSHEFNDPSMTTSNASASAVKVRKAPDLPMPPDLEKLMGKFACAIIANLFWRGLSQVASICAHIFLSESHKQQIVAFMSYMRTSDFRSQLQRSINAERDRNTRLRARVERLESQVCDLQKSSVSMLKTRFVKVSDLTFTVVSQLRPDAIPQKVNE